MNMFDAAILVIAIVAIITGFKSGLLRSMATILGYVTATPIALSATPMISRAVTATPASATASAFGMQNFAIFFAVLLIAGFAIGTLLRSAVEGAVGPDRSLLDRLAGSALGAVRVVLVAVTLVLVIDRIIPPAQNPAFLAGSQLRPMLSLAGKQGLQSLPPQTANYIDQLKNARRL